MRRSEGVRRHSSQISSDIESQGEAPLVGDATPDEVGEDSHRHGASPRRKRGKMSLLNQHDEPRPSLFNFGSTQDSSLSQQSSSYSQEVANRFGQMTCRTSQDNSLSNIENDDSQSNFTDIFSMPSLTPRLPHLNQTSRNGPTSNLNDEKKITVSPAVVNPFLPPENRTSSAKGPTTIWLQPFRERPRYIMDFEEDDVIGEGQFSTVFKARKRLDGKLYAIKKLKTRVHNESEGLVLLREVCALAALKGCPNLLEYYGCWFEDSQLLIQCELCFKVNLDVFICIRKRSENPSLDLPKSYHPRRSTTPHSYIGSEDSGALLNTESTDNDNNDQEGTYIDENISNHKYYMQTTFESQSNSEFNLDDEVDETRNCSQTWLIFTPEVFWIVLRDICKALDFMHNRGIAHLDIRPANLLLAPSILSKYSNVGNWKPLSSVSMLKPKSSSMSLFESVQQAVSTPRAMPNVASSDSKISFDKEVDKTYQALCAAVNSSKPSFSTGNQHSQGIAFSSSCQSQSDAWYPDLISAEDARDHIVKGDWEIRVADLGLCCSVGDFSNFTEGESRYCAGELIHGESGTQDFRKADMFSLGASLYEMCAGEPLSSGSHEDSSQWHDLRQGIFFREKRNIKLDCNDDGEYIERVVTNDIDPIWSHYPKEILNVLEQLMNPDASSRPTAMDMICLAKQQLRKKVDRDFEDEEYDLRQELTKLRKENKDLRHKLSCHEPI